MNKAYKTILEIIILEKILTILNIRILDYENVYFENNKDIIAKKNLNDA